MPFFLFGQVKPVEHVNTVFNKLVLAYGSAKSAPQLIILNENSKQNRPAFYESYPKPTINIDLQLIDICNTFGSDNLNALSIVISHELAHYYSDHTFCSDYAFAIRKTNRSLGTIIKNTKLEEKIGKETEADQKGLFYAAAAGYRPFTLQENLLDKIYANYDLPDTLEGYPSKQQRKGIAKSAQEKAKTLYIEFNEGLNALKEKHYDKAIIAFENVNSFIPFRENYNNIGVAKTLKALFLKPPTSEDYKNTKDRFRYPLEIENKSRLAQVETRSLDNDSHEQMYMLLKSAQKDFQEAIRLDPYFTKGYINLACVFDLLDNPMAAIGKIKELPIEKRRQADAQRILAIAFYNADMEEKAKEIWNELKM
jgi:predicted Zn-dependent protease